VPKKNQLGQLFGNMKKGPFEDRIHILYNTLQVLNHNLAKQVICTKKSGGAMAK
jgi:hypothetical protein